jgi:hypothetical protein
MKKFLLVAILLTPLFCLAEGPFDGTWRFNLQNSNLPEKPDVYSVQNSTFSCSTCVPKLNVKDDGQDHKVNGSPYFDTVNVKAPNDHSLDVTYMKGGRLVGTENRVTSDDGNVLTTDWKFTSEAGKEMAGKNTYKRVGTPPASGNKVTGSWRQDKVENTTDNWVTYTFKESPDGLSFSDPTGDAYEAKFDGKDYPYHGDPGTTSVVVKKIDANTIEETDKRNGKVISIAHMTVAPDGKSMTVQINDKLRGTTAKYIAEKQ